MSKPCNIRDLNNGTPKNAVIQGKITTKSNLLLTKHKTPYFWCLIHDKPNEKTIKKSNIDKASNEIKIMFWDPFGKMLFSKIQKGKIYDFKGLKITKTNRMYHKHCYQLTWTKHSTMKEKQSLSMMKNGFLCNQPKPKKNIKNQTNTKLQTNIKHFFLFKNVHKDS